MKLREGGGHCGGIPSQKVRREEMSWRGSRRDDVQGASGLQTARPWMNLNRSYPALGALFYNSQRRWDGRREI